MEKLAAMTDNPQLSPPDALAVRTALPLAPVETMPEVRVKTPPPVAQSVGPTEAVISPA